MMLLRASAPPTAPSHTAPAMVGRAIGTQATSRTMDLDVLLLDAELRQTLAPVRVYAHAGLRVGAVACESESWWAPSLRSRWCSMRATVPDYSADADAYVDAVLRLLDEHPARMMVPGHDGSIQAIRLRRAEIER